MVMHQSFSDFVLFLYVHMAFADGELHPEEEKVILEKFIKHYPAEREPKNKFDAAVVEYQKTDAANLHSIIKESFKHFDQVTFALRYKIYTDMYDIILADGKVEISETKAVNELKEIIDLVSVKKTE